MKESYGLNEEKGFFANPFEGSGLDDLVRDEIKILRNLDYVAKGNEILEDVKTIIYLPFYMLRAIWD